MSSSTKYGRTKRSVLPPPNRGMLQLDRSKFVQRIPCVGIRVDGASAGPIGNDKVVQSQILSIPRLKTVVPDPSTSGNRLVLLDVSSEDQISEQVRSAVEGKSLGFVPYELEINYDYWGAVDILHAILPEELVEEAPNSFTHTGHIAHINLRDEFLPYRYIIGQVILDKNKNIRTVVNKLDTIDTQFRFFKMEVIAGDEEMITTANEANCRFTFDFSKVYWNSRLQNEHERLVEIFSPGQVVADVMAGVGPFAVPAARKGVFVLGNDLNPESAKWMEVNRVNNKVQAALRVSNVDGREFIRSAPLKVWKEPFAPLVAPPAERRRAQKEARRAREMAMATKEEKGTKAEDEKAEADLPIEELQAMGFATTGPKEGKSQRQTIDHFVMNLPGSALEFLDAYNGCCKPLEEQPDFLGRDKIKMPLVHTHCFTKKVEEAEADICERASGYLDYPINPSMDGYNLHWVRAVAPNKDMYCLTFRLPCEVAFK